MSSPLKIGMVAGEASGDLLGAKLIRALQAHRSDLNIEGIGGPAMIAAGCHSLFDMERLSVMGLVEPLLSLPSLFKLRHHLYQHFIHNRPDVFIGIDAPDFNIGLELKLKKAGIPIIHYVSPSVWAWRRYRLHKIAKAVDLMLTLLPFEAQFYEAHHVPVRYVGHPLADLIPLVPDKFAARRALCIDEHATYIAILPGSRRQEIAYMSEPFLQAAKLIWQQRPEIKFITSHVNEKRYQAFYDSYQQQAPDLPMTFFTRRSQDVMAAADVVLVTSGTATLETMLFKKPMVIAYRMSSLVYPLIRRIVKAPFAGLPNLLANELIVPELIQEAVKPEVIANHIFDYLDEPEKTQRLQNIFTEIHQRLRVDAATGIAESVFNLVAK